MAKPISKELKDEILTKIKTEGLSGAEAARRYGVNVKNIFRWLTDGVGGTSSQVLELNRLKRENQQLKQLIGQLFLDHERGQKIELGRHAMNKSKLARDLGIARSSLYYTRKRAALDEEVKRQIEAVMVEHPDYGHKRIALQLKMGHNRIRRVMKKYGLKPYRRRPRQPRKPGDQGKAPTTYPNLLAPLLEQQRILRPDQVWCTDFTYLRYHGKFLYLATVIDVFTREIVGVHIVRYHNRFLVIGALEDALNTHAVPDMVHSDQGAEYDSADFTSLVQPVGAQVSMSAKGAPWQNGYKASFYSHFKAEAGDLDRFATLGELVEFIYQHIYYYNHRRIHSALKMPPAEFRTRQTV